MIAIAFKEPLRRFFYAPNLGLRAKKSPFQAGQHLSRMRDYFYNSLRLAYAQWPVSDFGVL
ncbi:TPA: hypothetical protein SMI07_001791 [Serratia liquefaciens]|uniref:hypothetical protein n=1 Tax=Serratia sp. AXJ-M TaxID=2754727 RepID=UPI0029F15A67|nr:hypothetical protein [Serratia liquefaciens]